MSKERVITDYRKEIIKLIKQCSYRYSTWSVFTDFVEMSAIAISNSVNWVNKKERENQYLKTINKYDSKEQRLFPVMLSCLVEALEHEVTISGPKDILGEVFHELGLHNKWKGQFFTPGHVCEMMGLMMVGDKTQNAINDKGYISLNEPCVGSGAMVLGFAKAIMKNKINYCKQLVVTAQDIDLKCVYMSYLQLSLYGIPAVVIHGNSLTVEEWSRWYTPVYMLDGWVCRQQCGMTSRRYPEDEAIKRSQEPTYAAIKEIAATEAATTKHSKPVKEKSKKSKYEQISIFDINF